MNSPEPITNIIITNTSGLSEHMSLRDWFAGMAMIGYRASGRYCGCDAEDTSEMSYSQADAMLKQREEKE